MNEIKQYRVELCSTLRFLNESYDKILVTLSGGALGLSIAFLKDFVILKKVACPKLLLLSWLFFILSLTAVLGRIMFGIEAHRKAIKQVDEGTIFDSRPGGGYSKVTRISHVGAACFLVLGLVFLAIFAYLNVGG